MVPTRTKEAVWHEGCQQGHVPVGLGHLHLPQLHLDGLCGVQKGAERLQTQNPRGEPASLNPGFQDRPGSFQHHTNTHILVPIPQPGHAQLYQASTHTPDLGMGLRLGKLNLEVKSFWRRLLLPLY